MSTITVKVPDIGDFKSVEIIELLIKVGDTIAVEQSLITVESDKASMEIPSSHAGVVKSIAVKVGDKVAEGSVLLEVEAAESAAPLAAVVETKHVVETKPLAETKIAQTAPAPATVLAASTSTVSQTITVKVPDIGDFKSVEIIELMVKVGDTIAKEQSLITVESDKASMEIPSSHAGVVKSITVKVGDKVAEGSVLLEVETVGAVSTGSVAKAAVEAVATTAMKTETVNLPVTAGGISNVAIETRPYEDTKQNGVLPHASPSVRAFARELGADLTQVQGSAAHGRITQDDVKLFVKNALQNGAASNKGASGISNALGGGLNLLPWPKVDFAKFGAITNKPLTRIQKLSGPNLARNWAMIPHVTQFDLADITELEQFRKDSNAALEKQGIKMSMLALVMKACVNALQKFPAFNSSLSDDGESLVLKQYYNLGFAADTPNGLMVPVLKNVDQKGVAQIAKEMAELATKARDGKLAGADMQGATFTISSLGGIGGTYFTPIINAPEVAILGLSKSDMQPVWDGKAFAPRLMLPLSLSYDHRVIDGAQAARFTTHLAAVLADMRKVLL